MEKPLTRDYITLAPAQRIDLWVDFGIWEPGHQITLVGSGRFPIFSATIRNDERLASSLPETLTAHEPLDPNQASNANNPRVFELGMGMGMRWTINGRTFEMTDVAGDEKVRLGNTEVWEFRNIGGTGMGMMNNMVLPHPMHVHGLQFKVLDRQVDPSELDAFNTLKDGFVDEGWHDTVLVMPGERVRILMQFKDFSGLYLYHCHNLEHEDMGMMRNYQVNIP